MKVVLSVGLSLFVLTAIPASAKPLSVQQSKTASQAQSSQTQPVHGLTLASDRAGNQALVYAVAAGSSAEKAGVRVGDFVVLVGGERVRSVQDTYQKLAAWQGEAVTLTVQRGSERLDLLLNTL